MHSCEGFMEVLDMLRESQIVRFLEHIVPSNFRRYPPSCSSRTSLQSVAHRSLRYRSKLAR